MAAATAQSSSELIDSADLRPLNEIVKARLGRKISPSTVWRWILKGTVVNGQRIKLEAVRVAGCWCTSHEAFATFLRAQTAAALGDQPDTAEQPVERDAATTRKLKAAGLL